jgi:5,5'-dehydrodivanillate O-demethylase
MTFKKYRAGAETAKDSDSMRQAGGARTRYEDFVSVGPDSLAGKMLRMYWQPVYVSDKLQVGRPARLKIMDEDFTIYRGRSGRAFIVGARCPHRGLLLSTGRVRDDTLECFYHGWTFDGRGQCVAQPCEPKSFADKIKIPGYPVREYLGLVFAYFGEGEAPEFPTLDIFEGEGFVELREEFRPWPVFTQIENSVDETHFNFAHRRSKFDDVGMNNDIPVLTCEETDYGLIRRGTRAKGVRTGHYFMPNSSLSSVYEHAKGWAEHLVWRVPIDDETHISFMADFIYKTGEDAESYRRERAAALDRLASLEPAMSIVHRVIAGEMHADDIAADRPDIVMIQDAISCVGQGTEREREDDNLGASDRVVSLLRRLWTREMRAIDQGGAVKRWTIPKDLQTTRGVESAERNVAVPA